jgi:hypothetical protein
LPALSSSRGHRPAHETRCLSPDALDRLQSPTVAAGLWRVTLPFGDPRVMPLLQAIAGFTQLPTPFWLSSGTSVSNTGDCRGSARVLRCLHIQLEIDDQPQPRSENRLVLVTSTPPLDDCNVRRCLQRDDRCDGYARGGRNRVARSLDERVPESEPHGSISVCAGGAVSHFENSFESCSARPDVPSYHP